MKKITSALLIVALLLSCSIFTGFAETKNTKLSPQLQQVLDNCGQDDLINVYLSYKTENVTVGDMPSWPDLAAARAEMKEYSKQKQKELQAEIFKGFEYTVINEVAYSSVIVTLRAGDIEAVAQNDLVQDIDFVDLSEPAVNENKAEPGHLYEQKFCEQKNIDSNLSSSDLEHYEELYYHKDESGETDWVLVKAYLIYYDCTEQFTLLGHRILITGEWRTPCKTGFWVYDVKGEAFHQFDISKQDEFIDSIPELTAIFDEYGEGIMLGDMDNDNELTILDVTLFQRCEAGMRDFPENDKIESWDLSVNNIDVLPAYYSDFNCDGERDITDATAMQRYLVGLSV